MNTVGYIYPEQKTTLAKKSSKEWNKANTDYWISQAAFGSEEYSELTRLAKAAEGVLDVSEYKYVLNPFNVDDDKLKNFPSQMRNYNIITPIINARCGERSRKPDNVEVIVTNPDAPNKKKDYINQQIEGVLAQMAVNAMNDAGIQTGVKSKEIPDVNQMVDEVTTTYNDKRAIFGQEALDYIKYNEDLKDKYQDCYRDWLTYGRCFTYKDAHGNDVNLIRVCPQDFWFSKGYSNFVEDGNAFVWRRRMNINDIIDCYEDMLGEEDIKWLESQVNGITASNNGNNYHYMTSERIDDIKFNYGYLTGGLINVYCIVWKTLVKVGFLTYYDELGQIREKIVDDTYKLDTELGDISIEWKWQNKLWQNYRLGEEGGAYGNGIYFGGYPVAIQRNDLNNESIVKSPFNGRVKKSETGSVLSMTKDGLVYQCLFNIYQYNMEMSINRNKDKIMLMPIGMFPKEFGADPITAFLYYVQASSFAFFDETKNNAANVINSLKSIDMGLGTYIAEMRNILIQVRNDWWDVVGFNRERYGETFASDGKGKNEQAIFRSTIITSEEDRQYDKFLETDYQGLLDVSKVAWIDGKVGAYVNSDGRSAFLQVNGVEHMESNYGVFVKDNADEQEKLKMYKEATYPLAQKGVVKTSTLGSIIQGNNFSRINEIVKKAELAEQKRLDEERKAEEAQTKYVADTQKAIADQESDDTRYVADKRYDQAIESALINTEAALRGYDEGIDADSDVNKMLAEHKKRKEERELALKERQQMLQEKKEIRDSRQKDEKLQIDRKKAMNGVKVKA